LILYFGALTKIDSPEILLPKEVEVNVEVFGEILIGW